MYQAYSHSVGPLVTFHVNSYNRLPLLKNLLRSFERCNECRAVEWIITDYGSTDGSKDFIKEYQRGSDWPAMAVLGDQEDIFAEYRAKGLSIDSRWAKHRAVMGRFRREARRLARGDFLFDVADDHQFIRPGNWLEEIQEIYRHRQERKGRDDIAGVVACGYRRIRLDKPNNARWPAENTAGVPYFVAREKSYVDYSVMKRSTCQSVGEYLDPVDLIPGTKEATLWEGQEDLIQSEAEYERRCREHDLVRVFMKYPVTVAFPNDFAGGRGGEELIVPLWSLGSMQKRFGYLDRPVSSDELGGWNRRNNLVAAGLSWWRRLR